MASFQSEQYQVAIPEYEGPLDLLLDLIERAELDITRLAIAAVTDQYLASMQALQNRDPGQVSAFLVIAARLVQIKSEALLPRPAVHHGEEEDPGERLAQQLIVYRRFKQIAQWLNQRSEVGLQTYLRLAPAAVIESKADLSGVTISDLINAAQVVFAPQMIKPLLSTIVSIPILTIRNRIRTILTALNQDKATTFLKILGENKTRLDVVVTFLAILELVKQKAIETHQDELFMDIELFALPEWNGVPDINFDTIE